MRFLAWNLGWLVLALAWLGPLPELSANSFTAHMTLHMAVVAVASPLLAIAWAGCRFDPVERRPALFSPIVASVGELLIVWVWHAPRLHHWARYELTGLVCEQVMFLAAGLWVWLSAFGGPVPRSRRRSAAGVIGLLLTSMHMTLLGALLATSPRLLYQHHQRSAGAFAPLFDQHLGGAVMLVVGGASFLIGGLILTNDLFHLQSAVPAVESGVADSPQRPENNLADPPNSSQTALP